MVRAISTPDFLYLALMSTGMPRPSSSTRHPPSARSVTSIRVAWPAMASSTELSTISQTRWWSPFRPVDPMYMPGRLRTASRPSRTWRSLAPYESVVCATPRLSGGVQGSANHQRDEEKVLVSGLIRDATSVPARCDNPRSNRLDAHLDPRHLPGAERGLQPGQQIGLQ